MATVPLMMSERRSVTKQLAGRYRRASKKERTAILDQFCVVTGYNRSYASRILRDGPAERPPPKRTRRRSRIYDTDVVFALRKVWATLDGICGKRLAAAMSATVEAMERHGELMVSAEVRAKLLTVSPATIDRLLSADRARLEIRGRSGTKPGTLLKSQIPVRTFAQWDGVRPGFVEVDLVGHDGGNPSGEFCQTLDVTDVATGWTETRAVRNKAQLHVFAALKAIARSIPFDIVGIDSDNGSEFINGHLVRYCTERKITFTRSRPYRKNDSCYVEQKNWTVVRRNVGYARFDTSEELAVLNELYGVLREHTNFFMPSAKLISRTREGSRVVKRYDTPLTPYARVLASPDVSDAIKAKLNARYPKLNPTALKRRIVALQRKLYELTAMKESIRRREVQAPDLEYIPDDSTIQDFEYILT
ncbi:MAG: integrase [Actinomycetota bacterium]|nr:integrase [Actinomycetota bacterium]